MNIQVIPAPGKAGWLGSAPNRDGPTSGRSGKPGEYREARLHTKGGHRDSGLGAQRTRQFRNLVTEGHQAARLRKQRYELLKNLQCRLASGGVLHQAERHMPRTLRRGPHGPAGRGFVNGQGLKALHLQPPHQHPRRVVSPDLR
jgi:hypothetical protein